MKCMVLIINTATYGIKDRVYQIETYKVRYM